MQVTDAQQRRGLGQTADAVLRRHAGRGVCVRAHRDEPSSASACSQQAAAWTSVPGAARVVGPGEAIAPVLADRRWRASWSATAGRTASIGGTSAAQTGIAYGQRSRKAQPLASSK